MTHLSPIQQLAVPQILLVFLAVLLIIEQAKAYLIPRSLSIRSHNSLTR